MKGEMTNVQVRNAIVPTLCKPSPTSLRQSNRQQLGSLSVIHPSRRDHDPSLQRHLPVNISTLGLACGSSPFNDSSSLINGCYSSSNRMWFNIGVPYHHPLDSLQNRHHQNIRIPRVNTQRYIVQPILLPTRSMEVRRNAHGCQCHSRNCRAGLFQATPKRPVKEKGNVFPSVKTRTKMSELKAMFETSRMNRDALHKRQPPPPLIKLTDKISGARPKPEAASQPFTNVETARTPRPVIELRKPSSVSVQGFTSRTDGTKQECSEKNSELSQIVPDTFTYTQVKSLCSLRESRKRPSYLSSSEIQGYKPTLEHHQHKNYQPKQNLTKHHGNLQDSNSNKLSQTKIQIESSTLQSHHAMFTELRPDHFKAKDGKFMRGKERSGSLEPHESTSLQQVIKREAFREDHSLILSDNQVSKEQSVLVSDVKSKCHFQTMRADKSHRNCQTMSRESLKKDSQLLEQSQKRPHGEKTCAHKEDAFHYQQAFGCAKSASQQDVVQICRPSIISDLKAARARKSEDQKQNEHDEFRKSVICHQAPMERLSRLEELQRSTLMERQGRRMCDLRTQQQGPPTLMDNAQKSVNMVSDGFPVNENIPSPDKMVKTETACCNKYTNECNQHQKPLDTLIPRISSPPQHNVPVVLLDHKQDRIASNCGGYAYDHDSLPRIVAVHTFLKPNNHNGSRNGDEEDSCNELMKKLSDELAVPPKETDDVAHDVSCIPAESNYSGHVTVIEVRHVTHSQRRTKTCDFAAPENKHIIMKTKQNILPKSPISDSSKNIGSEKDTENKSHLQSNEPGANSNEPDLDMKETSIKEARTKEPQLLRKKLTVGDLSRKILETRCRIDEELIPWKKKLLRSLEGVLFKRLRKIEKETGEKAEIDMIVKSRLKNGSEVKNGKKKRGKEKKSEKATRK